MSPGAQLTAAEAKALKRLANAKSAIVITKNMKRLIDMGLVEEAPLGFDPLSFPEDDIRRDFTHSGRATITAEGRKVVEQL